MAFKRSVSTLDFSVVRMLLTQNVLQISDEAYKSDNVEAVAASYEKFIAGVAQISDRLNPGPLKQAAKHVFNCTLPEAELFAARVVAAFIHCKKN